MKHGYAVVPGCCLLGFSLCGAPFLGCFGESYVVHVENQSLGGGPQHKQVKPLGRLINGCCVAHGSNSTLSRVINRLLTMAPIDSCQGDRCISPFRMCSEPG